MGNDDGIGDRVGWGDGQLAMDGGQAWQAGMTHDRCNHCPLPLSTHKMEGGGLFSFFLLLSL